MTTFSFRDIFMAHREIDETYRFHGGQVIRALNLLALPTCPRQHKADLNAVSSPGKELRACQCRSVKVTAYSDINVWLRLRVKSWGVVGLVANWGAPKLPEGTHV